MTAADHPMTAPATSPEPGQSCCMGPDYACSGLCPSWPAPARVADTEQAAPWTPNDDEEVEVTLRGHVRRGAMTGNQVFYSPGAYFGPGEFKRHLAEGRVSPAAASPGTPEALARRFHETYERLAPSFGYKTREASAVPWESVPEANKALMIAVCAELGGAASPGPPEAPALVPWDTACTCLQRDADGRMTECSKHGLAAKYQRAFERAEAAEAALAARDGEVRQLRDQLAGRDIELGIAYDEFKQLREQRTDPRLLRWCEWPGCLNHYNAVPGPQPDTGGRPWLRLRMTGVICPDHADRGHMPSWAWRPGDDYVTAICSCGESAEVRPTNLSAAQTWWAETHLPEIGAAS